MESRQDTSAPRSKDGQRQEPSSSSNQESGAFTSPKAFWIFLVAITALAIIVGFVLS